MPPPFAGRDRLVDRGHDLFGHSLQRAAGEAFVLPIVAGVEEGAEIRHRVAGVTLSLHISAYVRIL